MANERKAVEAVRSHDTIEIEHIIGKMIITAGADPAAVAVTAAIRSNHPEVSLSGLQCIDESSPTLGKIEITMHQNQRRALGVAPFETVNW